MKKTVKGLLMISLLILLMFFGLILWGNFSEHAAYEDPDAMETPEAEWTPPPLITPPPEEEPEEETNIPRNKTSMVLAVAGDMIMHTGINAEAKTDTGYDYTTVMGGAAGYLQSADFAVATMETALSGGPEYTGYPMFKSPDGLAESINAIGIDLINTANNHSMDGYKSGLDRTLDVLEQNGIKHVGTYRTQEERDTDNGITVVEVNGISIAFLSFTYGTNGIPIDDFPYAVNVFYKDYLTTLKDIDYDLIARDMEAARQMETDFIAVFMHWGYEYETEPVQYQRDLADFLFAEGADLILGSHTHCPEPMELRDVIDNEGNEKTGYIVYSIGNFISCQEDRYTNLTAVINISLEKDIDTGETFISRVKYAPMFMVNLGRKEYGISNYPWRYRLWDLHAAINSYEQGNDMGVITPRIYEHLLEGLNDIHSIFGKEFDMYYSGNPEASGQDGEGESGEEE